MTVTVIKQGYNIIQIFIGEPTKQMEQWVDDLNNNPLMNKEITIEKQYSDKGLHDLKEFLELT